MGPSPLNQDSLRGEEVGDKMWKLFDEAVESTAAFNTRPGSCQRLIAKGDSSIDVIKRLTIL